MQAEIRKIEEQIAVNETLPSLIDDGWYVCRSRGHVVFSTTATSLQLQAECDDCKKQDENKRRGNDDGEESGSSEPDSE